MDYLSPMAEALMEANVQQKEDAGYCGGAPILGPLRDKPQKNAPSSLAWPYLLATGKSIPYSTNAKYFMFFS